MIFGDSLKLLQFVILFRNFNSALFSMIFHNILQQFLSVNSFQKLQKKYRKNNVLRKQRKSVFEL